MQYWKGFSRVLVVASILGTLGACSTVPKSEEAEAPTTLNLGTVEVISPKRYARADEIINGADVVRSQGMVDDAARLYRQAAKEVPTYAAPWVRMAEMYYEAGEHLKAYQSATEALSRDPANKAAEKVKVLSSLQLANNALAKSANSAALTPDAKADAERLTGQMHELVATKPEPEPKKTRRTSSKSRSSAPEPKRTAPSPAPAETKAPAEPKPQSAPSAAPAAQPSNPFDLLK